MNSTLNIRSWSRVFLRLVLTATLLGIPLAESPAHLLLTAGGGKASSEITTPAGGTVEYAGQWRVVDSRESHLDGTVVHSPLLSAPQTTSLVYARSTEHAQDPSPLLISLIATSWL
jgi:hypothetical protein